jgi:dipeptidyl-peptidase-4
VSTTSVIRRAFSPAVILAALCAQGALGQKKPVTFESLSPKGERVAFIGRPPASWSADGTMVEVRDGATRVLLDPATLATKPAPAPGSRPGPKTRTEPGPQAQGRTEYEESPDKKRAAFVRDGNLVVEDAAGGNEWAATRDGGPLMLYGVLDWVYQEEVYGRGNFKGFWWSPDSARVAFLGLDQKDVRDFAVVDHVPAPLDKDRTVAVETTKYPKAGDPNPAAKLGIADAAAKQSRFVALEGYEPDILIVRVAWSPSGELFVQIQNRIQTWLDLLRVDPATLAVTRLFREESKAWVEVTGQPHWLKDGSFLWLSDRSGYRHVYRYGKDGRLVRAITSGTWAVRDLDHVDEAGGWIYFSATRDGAAGNNLYRAPLAGGETVRLTQGRGTHAIEWGSDHAYFIDTVSSLADPPFQRLHKADGTVVKDLGQAPIPALETHAYVQPALHRVPARDGFELDAMVIAPEGRSAGSKHPVWIETYSGPDAPSVRDAWNASTWFQFLAQQGYFVFQVNVRTASGKGFCTTAKCYRQFGIQELADLEDAVKWLLDEHPEADAARVGMTGWSFGGFMTAFALTHSKAFRLGVAGAGVYDWRLYDTIYTERYMATPALNPEGYKLTSCIEAAKDLHGHLVLVHGTMDDNVHFQNAVRFAYELQMADKPFDVMIYPKSRHGIGSAAQSWHLRQLTWRMMQQHLGGPRKP